LQGETTLWERFSGDSITPYNCNLERVGQYIGPMFEGAYSQNGPVYYEHCAYYGTDRITEDQQYPGTQVIDASDPANPQVTAVLDDTPAALAAHEAYWVNNERALLVLAENNGPNVAIYDISDCAHPVLAGQIDLEGSVGHMSSLSPDGMTYWVTQGGTNRVLTYVVDLTDPSNPVMLDPAEFPEEGQFHAVNLNPPDFPTAGTDGGIWLYGGDSVNDVLVIVDVSDYQARNTTPEAPIVSTLRMDPGTPEPMLPMMIDGHPHIFALDETGGGGGWGSWGAACEARASPFGYPLVVDVSDHNNPSAVVKLWLEVMDPANCDGCARRRRPKSPGTRLSSERSDTASKDAFPTIPWMRR
jgi:hypothetical protein